MKCIYCGAEIKEDDLRCPVCNREVQLVPDYNIMDDEYLKQLMEEEASRKNRGTAQPIEEPAITEDEDDDLIMWNTADDMSRNQTNRKTQKSDTKGKPSEQAKQKGKPSEQAKQKGKPADTAKKPQEDKGKAKKKKKKSQAPKLVLISLLVVLCVAALIAAAVLYTINNQHNNSYDYQVQKAEEAAAAGDTDSAISYYERALKLSKNSVDIRIKLGNLYLSLYDYDSALLNFEEALNLDGTSVDAYAGIFTIYDALQEYDKISEMGNAIEDIKIKNALADWLVSEPTFSVEGGNYDEAIEVRLSGADDCSIYYTLDGSDPLIYGTRYGSAFNFNTDGTYYIYAVCVNEKGVCSGTVSEKYVVELAAPTTPIVSPEGGNYTVPTQITISVPEGCTAYYTWDDTDPNISSNEYTGPFDIPLGSNVLSVIIFDDTTEKASPIYRSNYTYYES